MSEEESNQIKTLLEEILRWTRFQGWQSAKNILLDTLHDDTLKLIYHFSDGRSSREIAKRVPIHFTTVVSYWKDWAKIGIVESIKVRRGDRYRRIFSLKEFGIEIPKIEERKKGEIDE